VENNKFILLILWFIVNMIFLAVFSTPRLVSTNEKNNSDQNMIDPLKEGRKAISWLASQYFFLGDENDSPGLTLTGGEDRAIMGSRDEI
jgi:hypothetical protein